MTSCEPCGHYVQFYKADEPLLNRNVSQYLWEGLLRGDGLLVIATPEREKSVKGNLSRLGVDVPAALSERQLLFLDAEQTMARFMVDSDPDAALFNDTIAEALQMVQPRDEYAGVRAYGEMVGVLWEAGQFDAAIRLEEHWNKLLGASGITLFCGYPIDVFGKEIESTNLQALISAHTHHLPGHAEGEVHKAVHQAMDHLLGAEAGPLRLSMAAKQTDEMATILWLRKNLPDRADGILSCARNYYQQSASAAA